VSNKVLAKDRMGELLSQPCC